MTSKSHPGRLLKFIDRQSRAVNGRAEPIDRELAELLARWEAPGPPSRLDERFAQTAASWQRRRRHTKWAAAVAIAATLVVGVAVAGADRLRAATATFEQSLSNWLDDAFGRPRGPLAKTATRRAADVVLPTVFAPSLAPRPSTVVPALEPGTRLMLEVRAIALLSRADALAGRQLAVTSTPTAVRIDAVTDSVEEKAALLRALAPMPQTGAIRVEVKVAGDFVAAAPATTRPTDRIIEIDQSTPAALAFFEAARRDSLRARLGRLPDDQELTAELHTLATTVLRGSRSILVRAVTFADHAERFSKSDFVTMSDEIYAEWREVVRGAARQLGREVAALRDLLGPLLATVDGHAVASAETDVRALGRSLDEQLRRGFAIAGGAPAALDVQTIAAALGQLTAIAGQGDQWDGR